MPYNRLKNEKSQYLQQHAENPVDWYPWGEEAFAAAKSLDKPVFLSIGYSTCHWCHVMAHESFEDENVAALMNEVFINVKVDREERPDVDNVYMAVCQIMTGRGGWPLTIIMTPEKIPFFAGTYIPKESRYEIMGMTELVARIKTLWSGKRQDLVALAEKIFDTLKRTSSESVSNTPEDSPDVTLINQALRQLMNSFDEKYGGFNDAPKFPTPHNLMFLLRCHARDGSGKSLEMVEKTLLQMRLGGIYDHLGYGFHRYSTDSRWLIPHFEKMLYDQAMLAMAYIETYQATGNSFYLETAGEIFTYVLRDMTHPEGGFYSAEDADSEGTEGKFYMWSYDELVGALGRTDAALAARIFNVHPPTPPRGVAAPPGLLVADPQSGKVPIEKDGNFHDEVAESKNDSALNILYMMSGFRELSSMLKMTEMEFMQKLRHIRSVLYEKRKDRIHPLKDDKILTDWNGLMIAALAKAGRVLEEPTYTDAAKKAIDFILKKMTRPGGRLLHRYRDGEAAYEATVDDYAFLVWGLIETYGATYSTEYLEKALELNEVMMRLFGDATHGGLFITAENTADLPIRQKEIYDGAIPSGNSVAMLNLLRLARMTGDDGLEQKASAIARTFLGKVKRIPMAHTMFLCALDFAMGPTWEVVIEGKAGEVDTNAFLEPLHSMFLPSVTVVLKDAGQESRDAVSSSTPPPPAGSGGNERKEARAYVCRDKTCNAPTTSVEKMLTLLLN